MLPGFLKERGVLLDDLRHYRRPEDGQPGLGQAQSVGVEEDGQQAAQQQQAQAHQVPGGLEGRVLPKKPPQGPATHGQAQGAQAAQDAAVAVAPDEKQGPEPEEAAQAPPPGLKVDQPGKGESQEDDGKDMRPDMEVMGAGG